MAVCHLCNSQPTAANTTLRTCYSEHWSLYT